ncbi:MAG: carboxypeptidase regulatory-like domain-containing protein [Betaproteobacteria bacterium]|nr:carboxypeptidase regulatory-like domain-containing protein [Betaproteobacteria bacterium]
MRKPGVLYATMAALGIAILFGVGQAPLNAQQPADPAIQIGASDLGGAVKSANGPEASVWVIAETTDLPTRFAKIVVTDDRGRYLIPDLPKATYNVWVRGYGLVDSPKVRSAPGKLLDLSAVVAPSAAAAAEYYPAIFWYSLLKIPAPSEFPGTGFEGNGIQLDISGQREWLSTVKTNGCMACHALGTRGTRTLPKDFAHMNSTEAWARRIASGQAMNNMVTVAGRLGTARALAQWADWTDRIAAGELPFDRPARPQGIERNLVLTLWEWSHPGAYMHDLISTDRRKPTINANGKMYGAPENSTDYWPVLDPVRHTATEVKHPVRDPNTPSYRTDPMAPSPYWGPDPIWDSQSSTHNQMMDEKGRVWAAARIRQANNPDDCKKGSNHPSAKVFPLESAMRHLSMYDPASSKWTLISTCFPTHHVIFAEDANNTLWTSSGVGGPGVLGWLNRKKFEETGDEMESQGWTPFVLDTNGNGKRDEWVEPDQPLDPAKDKRIAVNLYSVAVNPVDGSVWGTALAPFPSYIVRVAPGSDPANTAITEIYEPPLPAYGARGGDIDRNGVFWASYASGHLGSFDRRKCKGPLNGPGAATRRHCPEGWTLVRLPGPQFRDVHDDGSAEASYYVWVDWFNTLGLGENVPIATGNTSDAYFALVNGKFVTLRVPYPMGFFAKWAEGRIDDPKAGWKGRALWATNSTRAPFHSEDGTKNLSRVFKFQLRPDPLAR